MVEARQDSSAVQEDTRGLLLVGVGGQGVILASNIVAEVLLRSGYDVKQSEVHGMSQRGGVVFSHIRYGQRVQSPLIARGEADIVVAFEWAEALRWLPYLAAGGALVASVGRTVPPLACRDRRTWASAYPSVDPRLVRLRAERLRLVDADATATALGNGKAAGSVLLGALAGLLDPPENLWLEILLRHVPPRTLEVNRAAFAAGLKLGEESALGRSAPVTAVPPPEPVIGINRAWCKGCDICVKVCPEFCLALDEEDKVVVTSPDACTGCRLCELLCPDFAITVRSAPQPCGDGQTAGQIINEIQEVASCG